MDLPVVRLGVVGWVREPPPAVVSVVMRMLASTTPAVLAVAARRVEACGPPSCWFAAPGRRLEPSDDAATVDAAFGAIAAECPEYARLPAGARAIVRFIVGFDLWAVLEGWPRGGAPVVDDGQWRRRLLVADPRGYPRDPVARYLIGHDVDERPRKVARTAPAGARTPQPSLAARSPLGAGAENARTPRPSQPALPLPDPAGFRPWALAAPGWPGNAPPRRPPEPERAKDGERVVRTGIFVTPLPAATRA